MTTENDQSEHQTHIKYLQQCIDLARISPPKPTNFRVGCVIVSRGPSDSINTNTPANTNQTQVLSTGYTLELEGNTHAEQCALSKLADKLSVSSVDDLNSVLPSELDVVLYTSLEPCGKRLSGNLPCVQRIIATTVNKSGSDIDSGLNSNPKSRGGIKKVIFGAKEPGTFVQNSQSCRLLTEAEIEWEYISDLESVILQVAMEGHVKDDKNDKPIDNKLTVTDADTSKSRGESHIQGTNIDEISEEERRRQEAIPRNPKKRMMEVSVPSSTEGGGGN